MHHVSTLKTQAPHACLRASNGGEDMNKAKQLALQLELMITGARTRGIIVDGDFAEILEDKAKELAQLLSSEDKATSSKLAKV
jgi:hypothetical protein